MNPTDGIPHFCDTVPSCHDHHFDHLCLDQRRNDRPSVRGSGARKLAVVLQTEIDLLAGVELDAYTDTTHNLIHRYRCRKRSSAGRGTHQKGGLIPRIVAQKPDAGGHVWPQDHVVLQRNPLPIFQHWRRCMNVVCDAELT